MNKILPAAAALLVAACGFHLKGTGSISQPLPYQTWHIVNGQSMQKPLETALRRANGKPAGAGEAEAEIKITHISTRRDVFTVTRAAVISEYLLVLRVEAQAAVNGQPAGKPIVVQVERKMDYADNEVLGKAAEENSVWSEMSEDAAGQIVTRLSFLKAQ